jgi:hypothetical protein
MEGYARASRLLSGTPASAPSAARWCCPVHANTCVRELNRCKGGGFSREGWSFLVATAPSRVEESHSRSARVHPESITADAPGPQAAL